MMLRFIWVMFSTGAPRAAAEAPAAPRARRVRVEESILKIKGDLNECGGETSVGLLESERRLKE